mgnify:CR=1 FL=1
MGVGDLLLGGKHHVVTAGVDRQLDELHQCRDVRAALEKLRASGLTMLIVEQKLDIALHFASRAYVLIKGRVVLEDSTASLARRSDLAELYFALATSSPSSARPTA